ncbi:MAG: 50S ribosomal protein L20 [Candidatus Sungiibacteriota bacterium]
MTRVKRGVIAHKRREKVLKAAKGFKWGRKSKERMAREALLHAWSYAFTGRKERKRTFRGLWQTRIGAAAKTAGISYSKLMGSLRKKSIALDRKVLAEIAAEHPIVFKKIAEHATQ